MFAKPWGTELRLHLANLLAAEGYAAYTVEADCTRTSTSTLGPSRLEDDVDVFTAGQIADLGPQSLPLFGALLGVLVVPELVALFGAVDDQRLMSVSFLGGEPPLDCAQAARTWSACKATKAMSQNLNQLRNDRPHIVIVVLMVSAWTSDAGT